MFIWPNCVSMSFCRRWPATSAFPYKITTVVNVIPKLSGHDQASFQQKVIDWKLLSLCGNTFLAKTLIYHICHFASYLMCN